MGSQPDWYAGLQHLWLPYAQMKTEPDPLAVAATRGERIVLADGRELVDGVASWWSACHGYNHPHIRQAVERQLGALPHVMLGGLVHEPALTLASLAPGRVDLIMGTFSKALGGFGAYVAGSQALIDYLVNACSGFIYTTAPPPPVLGAMDAALDLVPGMDAERAHLSAQSERLRQALRAAGIVVAGSTTQIVPAVVGGEAETLAISRRLEAQGLLAVAIRPPTVPKGSSRIRFALSAAHGSEDVDRLIAAVGEAWPLQGRAA